MTITGTFATGTPLIVEVDPWAVDATVETMFEMGALVVTTKENA